MLSGGNQSSEESIFAVTQAVMGMESITPTLLAAPPMNSRET